MVSAQRPVLSEAKERRGQRGFSLIELMVVVTIIGILAAIAVVNVRNMRRKATETALIDNLHTMRTAIDNFYADKQRYPSDLNELVPNYMKRVPKDPITEQEDWELIMETLDADAPENLDTEGNPVAPGVFDVKSKAPGKTLQNVPYSDL
jgi:general secretion pathway protein G